MSRTLVRLALLCLLAPVTAGAYTGSNGGFDVPYHAPEVASAPDDLEHTLLLEEEEVAPLPWPGEIEEPLLIEEDPSLPKAASVSISGLASPLRRSGSLKAPPKRAPMITKPSTTWASSMPRLVNTRPPCRRSRKRSA